MNFLKLLIENKDSQSSVEVEKPVTEAAKLELPDYSRRVGNFYLTLAGVYQNASGAINEVYVRVDAPNGQRYKVEFALDTPVKDTYDAAEIDFRPDQASVWGVNGEQPDDELSGMLSSISATFLNDDFVEALEDAFKNLDAIENPKRSGKGWSTYPRQSSSGDYD